MQFRKSKYAQTLIRTHEYSKLNVGHVLDLLVSYSVQKHVKLTRFQLVNFVLYSDR